MVIGQMDYSLDIWNKTHADRELDELIRAWHESDSELPLIEFLGVSGTDYAAWVEGRLSAEVLLSRSKHG